LPEEPEHDEDDGDHSEDEHQIALLSRSAATTPRWEPRPGCWC